MYTLTFNQQIKLSSESYSAWLRIDKQKLHNRTYPDSPYQPLVSFLVPHTHTSEHLLELIKSLKAQIYPHWELVVVTGMHQVEAITTLDSRIKYLQDLINQDYLSLSAQAKGDFVVCAQAGDQFSNCFLSQCVERINQNPEVQIIYTDHDLIDKNGKRVEPFFKPDTCSLELLYSTNYLSRSLLRREMVLSVGHILLDNVEPEVQEWELNLNCATSSNLTAHIADVLVHYDIQRKAEENQTQISLMLAHYLSKSGFSQPSATPTTDSWRIIWQSDQPLISIIIPSKNNYQIFKRCLDSIFTLTTYKNYELIIVDNGSTDEALLAYYQELEGLNKARIVAYNELFNYSHAINLGASAAKGDVLLFLNNDIQVLSSDWLDELSRWTLIPEIGVVGSKLLYPNGQIQHAGVVLGLEGFVDHLYMNAPRDYCGLIGSVNWYRNVSAVTGACQMMRRSVFDELGGYDENYHLIYSDIDICLKAIRKNYRILYTPFARLIHYHGLSRNRKDPIKDLALGFKDLLSKFDGNDPFFSPNLTYTYIPRCQIKPETGDDRIARMREKQAVFERWASKSKL